MTTCAVCGDQVDTATAPKAQYQDETYFFCCEECKQMFLKNPKQYAKASSVTR